jgi:hypothetical protein
MRLAKLNILKNKTIYTIEDKLLMKTILVLTLLLMLLIFSCKKSPNIVSKDITGNWEWILTQSVYPSDPVTPQSSGIYQTLEFKADNKWGMIENGIKVDSGTYSLGHGCYLPYVGAHEFIYDSIVYYRDGINQNAWDYYNVFNDTLQFCPGLSGKLASYNSFNFPDGFNGTKILIKK